MATTQNVSPGSSRRQVNSATLIMGPTGSGKSALIGTLAKYVWETYGKITRLYSCDGGGIPEIVEALVAVGIIEIFRMRTRDPGDRGLAPETCYRSAQGWWPAKIRPSTGEVPAGVMMLPPVRVRYEAYCPQGHLMGRYPTDKVALAPRKCPTCGVMVNAQNLGKVQQVMVPTPGFEKVGAVAYDGITSMLSWIMLEAGHRTGRGELKGEGSALGGVVLSGDLKFGGTNRAQVGFAQTRGEEIFNLTQGIPGLVIPPVFTALTHEDVDDRSLSIRGPKIAGRAKTDEAGQWVGHCLEAAIIPALDGSPRTQRVLYLDEFVDAQGVKHLVKNRATPGTMPSMLIDPPYDPSTPETAFSQFNLGLFFSMIAAAREQSIQKVQQDYPNAPGLPEGDFVDYGQQAEDTPAIPAVAAAVAAPASAVTTTPAPAPTTPAPRAAAPRPRAAAPKKASPATVPAPAAPAVEAPQSPEPELPLEQATTPAAEEPIVSPAPEAALTPDVAPAAAQPATPPAPMPKHVPARPVPAPQAARPVMAPPPGVRPATAAPRPPAAAPRIPAPRPTPGAPNAQTGKE